MATQTMASECIGKHFITVMLLTGNVRQAEAAVLDGIRCTDLDQMAASVISREALRNPPCADNDPGDFHAVASLLPTELRRVLYLTPDLRRYFVLRMLVGMSRERCATLLKTDIAQVDRGTRRAITELARIAKGPREDSCRTFSSHLNLHQYAAC
jgi:hypothetical protein